ncbi:hypothetical protein BC938DRAFT_474451 [Jimgerdemannia flammicorona]|uniref:Uncharacterized protein n=1 Tax=Jimgerdemannia flammicorona TaxID=994334 RepID=A0A433Q253_9FUNG|nr:hypothetical protein BC938DRAFT_474451 [Jimgerdemannia flammicorona]
MMESLAEETATESRAIPVKRKQSEDFGEPGGIEEQEAYPMGSKEGEIILNSSPTRKRPSTSSLILQPSPPSQMT